MSRFYGSLCILREKLPPDRTVATSELDVPFNFDVTAYVDNTVVVTVVD